jgi:hypothetical protein
MPLQQIIGWQSGFRMRLKTFFFNAKAYTLDEIKRWAVLPHSAMTSRGQVIAWFYRHPDASNSGLAPIPTHFHLTLLQRLMPG